MSDQEIDILRSTFPSYMAEGERLYLCGEFSKAATSFSNVSGAPALSTAHRRSGCLMSLDSSIVSSHWLLMDAPQGQISPC